MSSSLDFHKSNLELRKVQALSIKHVNTIHSKVESKFWKGGPYNFPIRWSNSMGGCCGYKKWRQPRRIKLSLSLIIHRTYTMLMYMIYIKEREYISLFSWIPPYMMFSLKDFPTIHNCSKSQKELLY